MQVKKPPTRRRQKRCPVCHNLFQPDPRTKGKQRYCSAKDCQRKRQRQNEKDWRIRNPECVQLQQEQSRQWHKTHPDYSRQRRVNNPNLLKHNREQTLRRMRKLRARKLFDKSKLILTQLTGNKENKCYLTKGLKWLHIRLTKASLLSRGVNIRDNPLKYKRVSNRLPRDELYDLSGIFTSKA